MSIRYNNKKIAGTYKIKDIGEATTSEAGLIKIATQTDVTDGTNNTKAITPKLLNISNEVITSTYNEKLDNLSADLNTKLTNLDNTKQDVLTAGDNITISTENDITTISSKDTVYTAGEGIDITNNVISNTNTTSEWGKIIGDITSQNDLQDVLNTKVDVNYLNTQLSLKQDVLVTGNGIEIDDNNTISGTTILFRDWSV